MPRSSKVETCLLCGEVPCACSAGNKKSKPPAKTQKTRSNVGAEAHDTVVAPESSPVQSRPSMRDKMKAAAAAAPVAPRAGRSSFSGPKESPPQLPPDPDPNLVLAAALRVLAPMLHEDEMTRYSMIVGSAPTTAERAAFWRARVQGDS